MGYIDQPSKTINIIRSQDAIVDQLGEHRVLIVGQLGEDPYEVIPEQLVIDVSSNANEIDTLFGKKNHITGMIRKFKEINKVSPVDVFPFYDAVPGGALATINIPLSTSDEDATINVTVLSAYEVTASIDIPSGTSSGDIIAQIKNTIDPLIEDQPLTITEFGSQVAFTADQRTQSIGNDWDIKVSGNIPGVPWTVSPFAGGTGGPTTPGLTLIDAIAGRRYQTIVWPASYDAVDLVDEMDQRFNADFGILDGIVVQTKVDTLANVKDYVDDFNSQSFVVLWNKFIDDAETNYSHTGGAIIEMPDIISSKFAALRSLRLTEGSNLTPYISTSATLDQFGGASLASLPYFNTIVPFIATPLNSEFPDFEDIEEATSSGASVIGPNSAFNTTLLGEMVTTYLVDPVSGDPDPSYKFLNTVDTVSAIRELVSINCARRYSQTRLTQGVLIPRRDMANEKSIRAFLNEVYDELSNLTLVASGSDAKRDFNETLVVTVDIGAQKATIDMQPLLVTQLRAIVGTIAVNFGG